MCNSLVINLFGGPGSRKSTMAADIFARLKWAGVNCELATEYAKDKVWEGTQLTENKEWKANVPTLDNQLYVFGKQHHRIFRLLGKVDVIITDSPILLTILYDKKKNEILKQLVLSEFRNFNNLNLFVKRQSDYNPMGRMQTADQAIELDEQIKSILADNDIDFEYVSGTPNGAKLAFEIILEGLSHDKLIESL